MIPPVGDLRYCYGMGPRFRGDDNIIDSAFGGSSILLWNGLWPEIGEKILTTKDTKDTKIRRLGVRLWGIFDPPLGDLRSACGGPSILLWIRLRRGGLEKEGVAHALR